MVRVIYQTNCGVQLFSDAVMGDLLDNLETAQFDGNAWSNLKHGGASVAGRFVHWHTIDHQAKSVLADVERIRSHPPVPKFIPIYGFIYDVATGRLNEVKEASNAGQPTA